MIYQLFPTPVYRVNDHVDITNEYVQLDKFEITDKQFDNFGEKSVNTYILDDYRLSNLSRWIVKHINYYSKQMDEYFKAGLSKQDTINAIIELFYKTWYTSGSLTQKTYTENEKYPTWLANVGFAYEQAKTKGLY